jgi:hypothetical protein
MLKVINSAEYQVIMDRISIHMGGQNIGIIPSKEPSCQFFPDPVGLFRTDLPRSKRLYNMKGFVIPSPRPVG